MVKWEWGGEGSCLGLSIELEGRAVSVVYLLLLALLR